MTQKDINNISSEGMDKQLDKKFWSPKRIAMTVGGVVLLAFFIYAFAFMDLRSTLNVEKEKLTISTVKEGSFQEYIPVTGTVQPIKTVYLSALQGGIVEKVYKESGAMVEKGDTILTLSNSALRLNVQQRITAVYNQINQTRNARLNINQNLLNLKSQLAAAEKSLSIAKRKFERQKKVFEKQLISEQKFLQTKENFQYQKQRYHLLYRSFKQDSMKASRNLRQINQSLERMRQSLKGVKNILDKLVITAPLSGQLSTIKLYPGQSISAGERIGQVDILKSYKLRVMIDEFYLSRINTGLEGSFEYNGKSYRVEITKVYPVVQKGQFEVIMKFTGKSPKELRRGQTLRIRLELTDEATQALLLARGGFYQSTGGNWVFLVVENGTKAVRKQVTLGRQNPEYFEVLSGLEPGDKVITSSYDTFGDNEVLNFE